MGEKNEKRKNYETTIRQRVECEEKAFHVVNKLIDGRVADYYLVECGQLISREHYNDIVEERAITFLCGYPLCDNTLENIPKKKYHISTRSNKVYDISERKNFCSNQCLKASKHFCNQIPEAPVWARARMPTPDIKLLPHRCIKGIVGDEVVGASPKKLLEEEVMKLQDLDRKTTSSENSSKKSAGEEHIKTSGRPGKVGGKVTESREDTAHHQLMKKDKEIEDAKAADFVINGLEKSATKNLPSEFNRLSVIDAGSQDRDCSNVSSGKASKFSGESLDQELEKLSIEGSTTEKSESAKLLNRSSHDDHHDTIVQSTVDRKSDVKTNKPSQMNYLLELLSKRKNVLSGMADIQTVVSEGEKKDAKVKEPESANGKSNIPETGATITTVKDTDDGAFDTTKVTTGATSAESTSCILKSEKKKKHGNKNDLKPKSPLEHIANILKTWITDKTTMYLKQSSSVKQEQSFSDPQIQRNYADLCKRLDAQQKRFENVVSETVDGDSNDGDEKKKRLKSTPDYNALKEESVSFQLKVTEFITGKRPKDSVIKKEEETGEEDTVLIPTVDAHDQLQIRIKIVLDRLDKSIPDLLGPLSLSLQDVSTIVRELVYTFRCCSPVDIVGVARFHGSKTLLKTPSLTSWCKPAKLEKDNIVFKPSEWTLVAIFILKMLAEKNRTIAEAFAKESAVRYFTIVLKSLGHSPQDIARLTEDILLSGSSVES